MKILIIRFSSIGDIVLTTPVIRCIKQQLPDVELHYLTKKTYSGIIETNPYIDKLHTLDNDWGAMINDLQKELFDYIIDLHHNLRTKRIKYAIKAKKNSYNKLNVEKWLMTVLKINRLPKVHIVDRYMDTVQQIGVVNDGKGLDYFIPEKDIVQVSDIPLTHCMGYIVIVIGAALNTKKLPVAQLKELCSYINHPIILVGGKEDFEIGEQITAIDNTKIYNACGKFNLNASADLVRKAVSIITHDTGLMHIAAAFKKPIVSIWGNTIPEFGMTPYYGDAVVNSSIFEVNKLWCRPCSKIGYNKCPFGHFKCMKNQDISGIAKKAAI